MWNIVKGFILNQGAKVAGIGGIAAVILGLMDRIQGQEPAHFCFTLDSSGGMLALAALMVLVAFHSEPPTR